MPPAREDCIGGEEEEDKSPLYVELHQVQGLSQMESEKSKDHQPEYEPGHHETSSPGSDAMACKTVAHGRYGGKQGEESANHDHPIFVINLVGEGQCDQG